nr:hypothetical protein [Streptomyces minutiscleroticus]
MLGSKAPLPERAAEPKRTAMLTAMMRHLEAKAIDEALNLFQVLMATRLLSTVKRKTEKERLSTLPRLERASHTLARAAKVLLQELVEEHGADLEVAALWAALEGVAPRAAVVSLVPKDEVEGSAEVAIRVALATRYATVRPSLSLLGESKALDAASAGKLVLAGVRGLPALARRKVGIKPLLPREVDDKLVPPTWRKAVYASPDLPQGAVNRDAYVVCALEQLYRTLNNRDVFVSSSHRWSNPRARLLEGPEWESVREDVLAARRLNVPVEEHLAELVRGLEAGWKQLTERLEEAGPTAKVSTEVQDEGRVKLHVDKLGALGEPKSPTWLRGQGYASGPPPAATEEGSRSRRHGPGEHGSFGLSPGSAGA